ncbi:hypothetical protein EDC96DRAFT_548202 [Choanephora cucurbitarum]|nr:hypothetical protein EDC96DRAFT_548202 [Choanephora cucurbitarum]
MTNKVTFLLCVFSYFYYVDFNCAPTGRLKKFAFPQSIWDHNRLRSLFPNQAVHAHNYVKHLLMSEKSAVHLSDFNSKTLLHHISFGKQNEMTLFANKRSSYEFGKLGVVWFSKSLHEVIFGVTSNIKTTFSVNENY